MEKLKIILAVFALALFATIACLALVMALRDIFGKSVELWPAILAAAVLWIAVGGSMLWDYFRERKNPRS